MRSPWLAFPFLITATAVWLVAIATPVPATAQRDVSTVREQRQVVVAGVDEIWQLVWDRPPVDRCGLENLPGAITCPCSGWAYGQSGKASLVRRRNGRELERMALGPLFRIEDLDGPDLPKGDAILQRWPQQALDTERVHVGVTLARDIKRRPAPDIMQMADYDRDGAATEFLLQVATLPCGKRQFIAVGVTGRNSRLLGLTTAAHPEAPLVMPEPAWQALARAAGPTTVPTWECGDHASERRTELVVSATNGQIRVRNRSFSCPDNNGGAERLIEDTEW